MYGVYPFVCPICLLQQRAAGLLLWAQWARDNDRLHCCTARLQQIWTVPRFQCV